MVGERDPKFYSELKQMDEDLIKFLQTTHEKSPYFDFTPTVNDYVGQMGDLLKQYPEKSDTLQQQQQQQPPLTFNSVAQTKPPEMSLFSSSAMFSNPFGTATSIFSSAPTVTSSTSFQFKVDLQDAPQVEEEEEPLPPEPQIGRFEELDTNLAVRCKVYEHTKGSDVSMSVLGIGTLYVKALDGSSNKLQIILRSEPDFMRVLLNEVVTPSIPMKQIAKSTIQILFPTNRGETKIYVFKLKNDDETRSLHDMLASVNKL